MTMQNNKINKIIIIASVCIIFVSALVTGFILFNKKDNNQESLFDNEQTPETIVQQDGDDVILENTVQDDLPEDIEKEEYYSVIFLDSNGDTLQSKLFKKGSTPYYSGKSLSSNSRRFNTWIPSISTVNGNQAYIATYFYPESSVSGNNNSSSGSGSTPSSSNTYASIIYKDIEGNQQSLILESGTTINFSAGEHGTYDSIPASITLTDNQQLDITNSSYNPSQVEVNYIFKGFSYSGTTMKCEYSLANNIVNVECKREDNLIIKNNVLYIKHEYIEATGTQVIDLGRKSSPNSSVELDIACEKPWVGVTFFNGNGGNGSYRYHIATLSSNFHFGINSEYNANPAVDGNRHILKLSNVTGDAYVDNTLVKTFTSKGTFTTPTKNMFLNSTQSKEYIGYAKYYGFKYYENGILVMDLIPVERVSDNEIGFLNDKDGTFFQNSGSGKLHTSRNETLPSSNIGKITASGTYETGQLVTLTALANDGYTFVGWSDGSTSQTKDIAIGDNTVYTALFKHN